MSQHKHGGELDDQAIGHSSEADHKEVSPIFHALAVLRGVRRLRKGKLTLRQAIAAAIEEGEAYKKWCANGTPVKQIQVWVESQLVITVVPEQIANLKSVHFDAPSLENSVMQLTKADEGEPRIVLFNLPLNSVRDCGLDETIKLPNGQRIR